MNKIHVHISVSTAFDAAGWTTGRGAAKLCAGDHVQCLGSPGGSRRAEPPRNRQGACDDLVCSLFKFILMFFNDLCVQKTYIVCIMYSNYFGLSLFVFRKHTLRIIYTDALIFMCVCLCTWTCAQLWAHLIVYALRLVVIFSCKSIADKKHKGIDLFGGTPQKPWLARLLWQQQLPGFGRLHLASLQCST